MASDSVAIGGEMIDLIHGDCLEKMKDIPDNSIDMVLTDCPYRLVAGGRKGNAPKGGFFTTNHNELKTGKFFKENTVEFKEWLPVVFNKCRNSAHIYIMVNDRNLAKLEAAALKAGFKFQRLLVWDKGNKVQSKWYMGQCEYVLMLRKGPAKNIREMGTSNLISIPNVKGKKHPTQKPVELMEVFIANSSGEHDIVLDLFMGTGSTGVACKKLNRRFIGIELDDKYFEIASERISKA